MKIYGSRALHRGEVTPSLAQETITRTRGSVHAHGPIQFFFFATSRSNYAQESYSIQKWNQSNICLDGAEYTRDKYIKIPSNLSVLVCNLYKIFDIWRYRCK